MGRLARFIRFYTDEDDGNGGEKGVLKTVTGALLHIVDALAKPINKFTATLEPIQDLHGQDAPYPAGGGKNKGYFGSDNLVSHQRDICEYKNNGAVVTSTGEYGRAGFSVAVQNGSTYTVSFKVKRVGSINNLQFASEASWNVNDYQAYTNNSFGEGSFTNLSFTFNATSDTLFVGFYVNPSGNSIILEDFQVEVGSSATAFAPYSNICPITGHTGANVVVTGKNVYDKVNHPFESYAGRTDVCWTSPIFLKKGTYTFTCNDGFGRCYLNVYGTYNDAVNNVNRISQNSFTSDSSRTDTFTSDVYIRYQQNTVTGSFADVSNAWQTEIGSSATTYEPYSGQTIPITFPDAAGTVYGGTLTNEDGGWKLRVTETAYTIPVNKIYLAGSWCYSDSVRTEFGYTRNFTIKKCNMLKPDRYTNLGGSTPIICTENGGYIYFGWDNMKAVFGNTQAEIREYLTNNPLVINFELATPIDYTLTESQALTLLKDTNNVWCDASDDLELQYYAKAE